MIDIHAARQLMACLPEGDDVLFTEQRTVEAARALLASIEEEYGSLSGDDSGLPQTIAGWVAAAHANSVAHGFHDEPDERTFGDLCQLFTSEISEAYEEYRDGRALDEVYENPAKPGKPEGIPIELGDVLLRIFDWFGQQDINLQAILERKHRYNKTRPTRHGGKIT